LQGHQRHKKCKLFCFVQVERPILLEE